MATLVKTSKGGFNLEKVTDWRKEDSGSVAVYLVGGDSDGQNFMRLIDHEAVRIIEILESVCLFDTTSPKQKG